MDPFRLDEHAQVPLSQDAALVAALAGTAMPFAHSAEDQAERWLRAIRLHGCVGEAMQALGIGEAPLMTRAEPSAVRATAAPPGDVAGRAVAIASDFAAQRNAACVGTLDLLFALFEIYGGLIDRALYLRGASKEELLGHLVAMGEPATIAQR